MSTIKVGYDPKTDMMGLPPILLVDIITLAKRGCNLTIAAYSGDPDVHIDKVHALLFCMRRLYEGMCAQHILPESYRIEWEMLGEVNAHPRGKN